MTFNEHGWLEDSIPTECIEDCAHSGSCDADVEHWVVELGLTEQIALHRNRAERYLKEYGAWDDLQTASDQTLAQRILWLACGDISDGQEWYGLVH